MRGWVQVRGNELRKVIWMYGRSRARISWAWWEQVRSDRDTLGVEKIKGDGDRWGLSGQVKSDRALLGDGGQVNGRGQWEEPRSRSSSVWESHRVAGVEKGAVWNVMSEQGRWCKSRGGEEVMSGLVLMLAAQCIVGSSPLCCCRRCRPRRIGAGPDRAEVGAGWEGGGFPTEQSRLAAGRSGAGAPQARRGKVKAPCPLPQSAHQVFINKPGTRGHPVYTTPRYRRGVEVWRPSLLHRELDRQPFGRIAGEREEDFSGLGTDAEGLSLWLLCHLSEGKFLGSGALFGAKGRLGTQETPPPLLGSSGTRAPGNRRKVWMTHRGPEGRGRGTVKGRSESCESCKGSD